MAKSSSKKQSSAKIVSTKAPKGFYPLILRSEPPIYLTEEMVDEWYRKSGKTYRIIHIPATNPRSEDGL